MAALEACGSSQLVGGGLFAAIAFVGGQRLIIGLLLQRLIVFTALFQVVLHALVVLVKLGGTFLDGGLGQFGLVVIIKQLPQVHRGDFWLRQRGAAHESHQQNCR